MHTSTYVGIELGHEEILVDERKVESVFLDELLCLKQVLGPVQVEHTRLAWGAGGRGGGRRETGGGRRGGLVHRTAKDRTGHIMCVYVDVSNCVYKNIHIYIHICLYVR